MIKITNTTKIYKNGFLYKLNYKLTNGIICNKFDVETITATEWGKLDRCKILSKPKKYGIYTLIALLSEIEKINTQYGSVEINPYAINISQELTAYIQEKNLTGYSDFAGILVFYEGGKKAKIIE
jgi:hypothetical protein